MEIDEKYMRRALDLARKGLQYASPNPMVGAVIVAPDGTILGEGYHRKCGGPHAEVNAIDSVVDKNALHDSTMYVTLEPCAHYGRTGPCAELIIRMGIPRVVIGCRDPFNKVNGRGIEMLLKAGVEVNVGCLEKECVDLNVVFFTAHMLKRPFIGLKWAQSSDGFMDSQHSPEEGAFRISSPLTLMMMHRLRGIYDAIMVGSGTVIADNPSLTTRNWPGDSPLRIVLDRRGRIPSDSKLLSDGCAETLVISDDRPLGEIMQSLYEERGITSVLVEGGSELLHSIISEGLWDFARVEVGPLALGENGGVRAPRIIGLEPVRVFNFEGQIIKYYSKNRLLDVKNV